MQKTEQPARLLHPPMTGKIFCILTSLLILAVMDVRAGEPIMKPALTLAMNRPPGKTFLTTRADLWPGADAHSASFSPASKQPVAAGSNRETASEFSSDARLEKQTHPASRDAFLLVHENLTADSRSNVSFNLQAGYGRIWDEKSMLQKIASDRQDPGCAYVSAGFSF